MTPEEELLAWAQEQLAGGAPVEKVEDYIRQETDYPNVFALKMAVEAAGGRQYPNEFAARMAAESAQEADIATALGGSRPGTILPSLAMFGAQALQGPTFGFADELAGLFNPELGAQMERSAAIRRQEAPDASALAEMAGDLMVPAGLLGQAARMPTSIGRAALRGAGRASLIGGASAGLAAAGMTEGSAQERAAAAARAAPFGMAMGVPLGAASGVVAGGLLARTGAGQRAANQVAELSGRPNVGMQYDDMLAATEQVRRQIQEEGYKPIAQAVGTISIPNNEALNQAFLEMATTDIPGLASVPRRQFRYLPQRGRRGQGVRMMPPSRQPSLEDLQRIRSDLRSKLVDRNGEIEPAVSRILDYFNEGMDQIPNLREVDQAYRLVVNRAQAIRDGYEKSRTLTAAQLRMQMNELAEREGDEVAGAFADGYLRRLMDDVLGKERGATARLESLRNLGDEPRQRLEAMFADPSQVGELIRLIEKDANLEEVGNFLRSAGMSATIGITGGIIGAQLAGRGEPN